MSSFENIFIFSLSNSTLPSCLKTHGPAISSFPRGFISDLSKVTTAIINSQEMCPLCEPLLFWGIQKTADTWSLTLWNLVLLTLQYFGMMIRCSHTKTPQSEDKVNTRQSSRLSGTDLKLDRKIHRQPEGYLFELKYS